MTEAPDRNNTPQTEPHEITKALLEITLPPSLWLAVAQHRQSEHREEGGIHCLGDLEINGGGDLLFKFSWEGLGGGNKVYKSVLCIYIYIHMYIYIYMYTWDTYIYIYLCTCMCIYSLFQNGSRDEGILTSHYSQNISCDVKHMVGVRSLPSPSNLASPQTQTSAGVPEMPEVRIVSQSSLPSPEFNPLSRRRTF